jgi:hypothetical protein
MAVLAIQQVAQTGLAPVYSAAAAGGDSMETGERNYLHVKNGGGASITVTVNSQRTCDQGFDHDLTVVVPATTGERVIGPITDRFKDPTTGRALITYTAVTTVTVGAFRA